MRRNSPEARCTQGKPIGIPGQEPLTQAKQGLCRASSNPRCRQT